MHALTASGALLSLLAIAAGAEGRWRDALAWMLAAMVIDAVDGSLARWVRVHERLPQFDGALLDNIVDYLGYVVVPAWLLLRADLVPAGAQHVAAAVVLLSSAYQFCQPDAKTTDHFFKGFPSYWNVVVFYMFFVATSPAANLAVIAVLATAVFVPARWAYPSRMLRLQRSTLALTALWVGSLAVMLATYPHTATWLTAASLVYPLYYVAISLWLTKAPAAVRVDSASR